MAENAADPGAPAAKETAGGKKRGPVEKLIDRLTALVRLHVSIPSAVSIAIIALVVFNLLKRPAGDLFTAAATDPAQLTLWQQFLLGIVSSAIAAAILGLAGAFVLDWYKKTRLAGTYAAFALEGDKYLPWGVVTIKFHPLTGSTHHTPVKLQLEKADEGIVLDGDGIIIDNRYLTGWYTETGEVTRRRSGAFMYTLDGAGAVWEGPYIYINPETALPDMGQGRWVRAKP